MSPGRRSPEAEKAAGPAPFAGFGHQALGFLRALDFHQSKAWFDENRALYESELRAPSAALVDALTEALAEADIPLRGSPASLFRLNRDVRFSKDKRPYKTSVGLVLSRDGTKRAQGFLYVHVDPKGCFAAAGFYGPEPAELLALRTRMAERPGEVRRIATDLAAHGMTLGSDEALRRLPKGFEGVDDPELGALLRLRSLLVRRLLDDATVTSPGLVAPLVTLAGHALPLLRFGWAALDEARTA